MAKSTSRGGKRPDPVGKQLRLMTSRASAEKAITYYETRYASRVGPKPRDGLPRIWLYPIDRTGQERMLVVPGEIIVRAPDAARAAEILGRRFKREAVRGAAPLKLTRFTGKVSAAELLDAVQKLRRHCIDASPNGISAYAMRSKASATPEHPAAGKFKIVGPSNAGANVHVVVIDTGLAGDVGTRPDLLFANIAVDPANTDRLTAVNQSKGLGAVLDAAAGHGTFVTSMVRRQAPKVKITMLRVLNSDGIATDADIAKAILDAARRKPDIVNMSFGSEDVDGSSSPVPITDAIAAAQAISPQTLFIAAAGNDANTTPTFPAALPGVVAVAGLTEAGAPAPWSKRGPWVQVSAPGQGVIGAFVHGTESPLLDPTPETWTALDLGPEAVWMGTSFATPSVTGAVAAEMTRTGRKARQALDSLMARGTKIQDWGVALKLK